MAARNIPDRPVESLRADSRGLANGHLSVHNKMETATRRADTGSSRFPRNESAKVGKVDVILFEASRKVRSMMTEYLFVGGPLDGERHRVHTSTGRLAVVDEFEGLVFYYPGTYEIPTPRPHSAISTIRAFIVDGRSKDFASRLGLMAKQPQFNDLLQSS